MALERLGMRPEETLCVGDAPFDIMSGKAAGCLTAAVKYTQVDAERFKSPATPDYWLTDLEDLILLVGEGTRRYQHY